MAPRDDPHELEAAHDQAHASVRLADLVRWSESLAGCACTGLGFTASMFERERFHEILAIAADIASAADDVLRHNGADVAARDNDALVSEWLAMVKPGIAGYQTPRIAIGALVGNENGELLLVQRGDSGVWLYPTGWADIGYSASEVVVKEVAEEAGLDVEPIRLAIVLDGIRAGISRIPLYSLIFHCKLLGGTLRAHPLECRDVGFFPQNALPSPLASGGGWVERAFSVLAGERFDVFVDTPRSHVWRDGHQGSAGATTS